MKNPPRILIVVGARPNFMKAAPLIRALKAGGRVRLSLVHTGQHYDPELSGWFFRDLKLPRPDADLGVGSGSHACQTAQILERFEPLVIRWRPDVVVVVGDVNSTLACALAARKVVYPRGTPADPARTAPLLAHVEAGLRSFDRSMPEEANRILTDHLCDLLFAPSRDAVAHLRREGIPPERIFFVGNVMIDSLRQALVRARRSPILNRLGLLSKRYALVTLHRPSNVDDPATARGMVEALEWLQGRLPVVFPIHPRTRKALRRHGLFSRLVGGKEVVAIPPIGYLDFLQLMANAAMVLTDSGGIQEETTLLKVPCLTLRTTTERPVTITHGTNHLVGVKKAKIVALCRKILSAVAPGERPTEVPSGSEGASSSRSQSARKGKSRIPPLWDGRAAGRIARVLLKMVDLSPRK